jgi:superoxide dismutase, Cu-Zn family
MIKSTVATALAALATAQGNDMNRFYFAECNLVHNPMNPMGWETSGQILMAQSPDGGALWMRA